MQDEHGVRPGAVLLFRARFRASAGRVPGPGNGLVRRAALCARRRRSRTDRAFARRRQRSIRPSRGPAVRKVWPTGPARVRHRGSMRSAGLSRERRLSRGNSAQRPSGLAQERRRRAVPGGDRLQLSCSVDTRPFR